MYVIEITENKINKLSEHVEESLRHMGKAMQCIDSWMEDSEMRHRSGYGMRDDYSRYSSRGGYGSRYGGGTMRYRDDEWEDEEEMMGERRRKRDSRGRYM